MRVPRMDFARTSAVIGTAVLALAAMTGVGSAASKTQAADSTGAATVFTSTAVGDHLSSRLTVTFSGASASSAITSLRGHLARPGQRALRGDARAQPGSGALQPATIQVLHCGTHNTFGDADGAMTISPRCDLRRSFWVYDISQNLGNIIVSPVFEHGLIWDRNGRSMPQMAAHTEPWDYAFHGTFNPTDIGDTIDYVDEYTFTVEVGGDTGRQARHSRLIQPPEVRRANRSRDRRHQGVECR